jgi:type VI secretion system protein ImpB
VPKIDSKSGGSVAPKERINISYKPATGGAKEGVELPLKLMVLGDFLGREDDRIMEDRKPVSVHDQNFDEVMASQNLTLNFAVPNHLVDEEDADLEINLSIDKLASFNPDNLMQSVPELREIFELRECLKSLKGPLGNVPQMRRTIQRMIKDEDTRNQLMKELGL